MKQTEIGLIPDDWEVKRLGELFEMRAGGDVNKQHFSYYKSDKYKYKIFSNGLENEGVYGFTDLPRYKGDSITITGRGTVGVSMYRKDDFDAVIRLLVLESRNKNQTNNFFISELINEVVKFPNESTGVPQLTVPQIKDVLIPLPPLPEQQRIAKALSDVDALISTTEKLIQKKKNIKQGAMQNLLTGKKRLPGFGDKQTDLFVPNGTHTKEVKDVSPEQIRLSAKMKQTELGEIPEDWEVKSLDELCSLITKQTGFDYSATIKPSLVLEHQKNTLPFIQNKDFEEERINFETDFYIPITVAKKFPKIYLNEDVLLISISGRIGNVAYFKHTQDAFIGGAVGIAHFYDKDNINYCMRYLLSPNGQMQIFAYEKSGAQHNLTIADVRKLSIPMPKDNKELNAIANVLSSMDKEIETLNTKLEKYRNLKTAMMQQLLTGKIRL